MDTSNTAPPGASSTFAAVTTGATGTTGATLMPRAPIPAPAHKQITAEMIRISEELERGPPKHLDPLADWDIIADWYKERAIRLAEETLKFKTAENAAIKTAENAAIKTQNEMLKAQTQHSKSILEQAMSEQIKLAQEQMMTSAQARWGLLGKGGV